MCSLGRPSVVPSGGVPSCGPASTLICAQVSGKDDEVVSCANFNAPGQIVVAGGAASVARLNERVGELKGKAIPLKVSAPFHCSLMAPAAKVVATQTSVLALPIQAVLTAIDAGSVEDDHCRYVLGRLATAGFAVGMFDVTSDIASVALPVSVSPAKTGRSHLHSSMLFDAMAADLLA